jgi:ribose transport system permease protein
LAAYLTFATPYFLTASNLANVTRQSSITAILAVGQTFVILTGGIDLSVGAIAALAASVSAVLMTQRFEVAGVAIGPIAFWLGFPIALGVGLLCGLLNGFIITKGRIPDFIATLGTMVTLRGVALLVTGGLPVPSHLTATELKGYLPELMIWMGGANILGIPVAGLFALAVGVAGWFVLRYIALGRAVYAIGGNREASRVSGINVDRTKVAVYAISGLLAGLAGFILAGRLNSANALMADGENLRSIAAVVIYRRDQSFRRRRRCDWLHDWRSHHGGAGQRPQPAQRERLLAAGHSGDGHRPGGHLRPVAQTPLRSIVMREWNSQYNLSGWMERGEHREKPTSRISPSDAVGCGRGM